jgi:hypothetical protein
VNTEGNFGVSCKEAHGVQRPGTGDHQAGGTNHTFLQRAKDGLIDRMAHPEIIGIDNQ